jgi:Uma2 family endonuclease
MMAAFPLIEWSEEEYLEFEETSKIRYEYLRGLVYPLFGDTKAHIDIVNNLIRLFRNQLLERPCKAYAYDLKVKVAAARFYAYPDVVVVCGEHSFESDKPAILLNPALIIEVPSPSTEKHDRTNKFQQYQLLDSLQEYLLVSQDKAQIERYLRQANGEWALTEAIGLDAVLELPTIGCTLTLSDVYRKVEFEDES